MASRALFLVVALAALAALLSSQLGFYDHSTTLEHLQQKIFGQRSYSPTKTVHVAVDEAVVFTIDTGPSIPLVSYDIGEPPAANTISAEQMVINRPVYAAAPGPVPPVVETASFETLSLGNVLVSLALLILAGYQQRQMGHIIKERNAEMADAATTIKELESRVSDAEGRLTTALESLRTSAVDNNTRLEAGIAGDDPAADERSSEAHVAAEAGSLTISDSGAERSRSHDGPALLVPAVGAARAAPLTNSQRRRRQRERAVAAAGNGRGVGSL